MKQPPAGLTELLALAAVDRARGDLLAATKERAAKIDAATKTAATAAATASRAAVRADEARRASVDASAKLEAGESELRRLSQQMDAAGGMKEYEGLKTRIESRTAQNAALEEAAFAAMEGAEAAASVAAACAAESAEAARAAETLRSALAPELADLAAKLAFEDARRSEAASRVPEALLRDYTQLAGKPGGRPVVPFGSGSCEGCFTSFGPQVKTRLLEGEIVRCGSCGRFVAPM